MQLIRIRIQHDSSQREERRRPGLIRLPSFKEKETKDRAAFLSSTFPSPPDSLLPLLLPRPDSDPPLPLKGEEEARAPLSPPPPPQRKKDKGPRDVYLLCAALAAIPFVSPILPLTPLLPLLHHPPPPPGGV